MKNIFKIYKRDMKHIFTNYAALIVITALAILPSLYAWFNIKASWDPYGSTNGIKVAVVNNDEGATLKDKSINIGDEVIDNLKDNTQMGWEFVDENTARKGVEVGNYYASLTIPKNFSKNLTSLVTSDIKKGEIIYTSNEKINAIAPKITAKGATSIQEQVNQTVVETVSEAIFGVAHDIGLELENQIPKLSSFENSLNTIQSKFKDVNETVDLASNGAMKIKDLTKSIQKDIPLIEDTLKNAQSLSSDISKFLAESKNGINDLSPTIKQDLSLIQDVSASISKIAQGIIDAINSGSEDGFALATQMLDDLSNKVSSLSKINTSLTDFLEKLNKFAPNHPLDSIISNLNVIQDKLSSIQSTISNIKDKVANGEKPSTDTLNKIVTIANDINIISSSLSSKFDSQILPELNNIFDKAYEVANNSLIIFKEAEAKLPEVKDILNTAYKGADKGIEGIEFVKSNLPKAENIINDLADKISTINNSEDLQEVIDLLKADVAKEANFLKQPVELQEEKLFPIPNYGSAMTPFYTVLSLWVGVLLLVSILSVNTHGEFTPVEIYFGKYLTFGTIALVQALIVCLGDLYILNIYCKSPIIFIFMGLLTSLVFSFIVYSLVSVFGNVGKVFAIILLVLQVAGSGGTFPIQVTPEFFQIINPFLPFTYAISAMRETIGGIVYSVLNKDIIILLICIIISVIISIFLKKPFNIASKKFIDKFNESELSDH